MTQPKDETLTDVWDKVSPPSDPAKRKRRPALLVLAAVAFVVTGCASQPSPPDGPPLVEWQWTNVRAVMTVCVGTDRLYGYQRTGSITVVPNGCAR